MSRMMRSCTLLLYRHTFNHIRAQAATLHNARTRHRHAAPPVPPPAPPHKDKDQSTSAAS